MKLGIMQPYLFPYIGYFQLINHVDEWIVFDQIQYIDRGWVNRNRIIHPNCPETLYITIPLISHKQEALINEVCIDKKSDYKKKILSNLKQSYGKRAPYFKEVYSLVEECLNHDFEKLVDLNIYSMQKVCEYIGINFKYKIFSKMNLKIDEVHDSGEWALNISKAYGAKQYVNPIGGVELFDSNKFEKEGISLEFIQTNFVEYNQKKPRFFEGLSIIDVMMFNSVEDIKSLLNSYEIKKSR